MEQHHYMLALDRKARELNGDYVPDMSKNSRAVEQQELVERKQFKEAEE